MITQDLAEGVLDSSWHHTGVSVASGLHVDSSATPHWGS